MIRRPPRSTQGVSSAASDVYKRQTQSTWDLNPCLELFLIKYPTCSSVNKKGNDLPLDLLSLIHISEPTRPLYISYAVFCLKKKKYYIQLESLPRQRNAM
eukprot:TRINITY_DN19631_c0_g1_i2.p2 TRINITY_DN19631_c0_g1~~TRINITY_DN19631_c0_g1_i2.p2  ORF type:complete len:100 (+),score=26.10 TRINITY_DN19631_c0_g1_i2:79-378(+)